MQRNAAHRGAAWQRVRIDPAHGSVSLRLVPFPEGFYVA